MFDISKHKYYLVRILKDIYTHKGLSSILGFKGGTAHMLFYNLPRFSVDLDFNLLDASKSEFVYEEIKKILLKYGNIKDEAKKHYGLLLVLNYKSESKNLKIEVSNRKFNDRYQVLNYLGIPIKVMHIEDMFAHKLSALTDRKSVAGRDIFDIHYFLKENIKINDEIINHRTGMELKEYISNCIDTIEQVSNAAILNGVGELVDKEMKKFTKEKLKTETISLLNIYKEVYL